TYQPSEGLVAYVFTSERYRRLSALLTRRYDLSPDAELGWLVGVILGDGYIWRMQSGGYVIGLDTPEAYYATLFSNTMAKRFPGLWVRQYFRRRNRQFDRKKNTSRRSTPSGLYPSFSTTFSDRISSMIFIGRSPRRFASRRPAREDSFKGYSMLRVASTHHGQGLLSLPNIGRIYRPLGNCCRNLGSRVEGILTATVLAYSSKERRPWFSSVMRLDSGCPGNSNVWLARPSLRRSDQRLRNL